MELSTEIADVCLHGNAKYVFEIVISGFAIISIQLFSLAFLRNTTRLENGFEMNMYEFESL